MTDRFAHLHVHTEFSMLDGAARLGDLTAEAAHLGIPALAITDHGNMHGAYDFYRAATDAGITPVLGIEAYVAPARRQDKRRITWGRPDQKRDDVSGNGAFTHMTMWARDVDGLHNLFRLNSRASIEGHYVKARMDADLIAEHAAGIMATTGCPSGEVQTRLRLGQDAQALAAAAKYQEIFGRENFFLELMDHGLDIERRVRDGLLEIARKLDLQPVVTNDTHYTFREQRDAHDALLCVQTGSQLSDANRFRFDGAGYHLRPAQEMYTIDSSDVWRQGCRNTLLIAERVDTTGMFTKHHLMPKFPVPAGETEASWFGKEVWAGMARRWPNGYDEARRAQAEYEIDMICHMGFPAYFLVVADFIWWAKNHGIPVGPGRGSAAGSIVAYALGITDLDPIQHGLIFERFLNPERVQMPDIDIDFDERGRADVIRYVTEKWGSDRVAQIATYGTIKAKAAIKDACRVLGFPYALGDKITKAMPPAVMGKDIPLSGIFDPDHPRYAEATAVRELTQHEPNVARVMEVAKGLEGLVRQLGVHAAGVIMSAEPLIDHVPLVRRDSDGAIITQFDYPTCETLGLLKMDFLGLRNLTIIDDALTNIQATTGRRLELLTLPLDDEPTYDLLARGDTLGVFQLDGSGTRQLLRLMKPDNFEDISAALALYRPGPMGANSHINYALRKNGQQEISPIHPELAQPLAEILDPTYGLIVYQEQVQRAAQKLAGYSLGKADMLRKAMGKKKKEVLDKEFVPFSEGMRANGYSAEAIQTLWDILVPFADYAFNKAHTACYGMISYWTAYLKANHPAEYMAALLTSVGDNKDKMALYLAECRRMGIRVLPPDVNHSTGPFTPADGNIRFGLAAVRNVGANVVASVVQCREQRGKYADFYDFLTKVDPVACAKKTVESLIKAGAFDSMGHARRALLAVHAEAVDACLALKRNEAVGQFDLFGAALGDAGTPVAMPAIGAVEWDKAQKLSFEREMLGLYVSDHPLRGVEATIEAAADTTVAAMVGEDEVPDGQVVTIAGILTGLQRRVTRKGASWASAVLEDLTGGIETLFFPTTFELLGQHLAEDAIVVVKGRISRRDDAVALVAADVRIPDLSATPPRVTVTLPLLQSTPQLINALKDVLWSHPGTAEVRVRMTLPTGSKLYRLGVRAAAGPSLERALQAVVGADNVEMSGDGRSSTSAKSHGPVDTAPVVPTRRVQHPVRQAPPSSRRAARAT